MNRYRVTVRDRSTKSVIITDTISADTQEEACNKIWPNLNPNEIVSVDDITVTTEVTGVSLPKR